MPSSADLENLPDDERLSQAAEAAKAAGLSQSMADSLKEKAAAMTDPKKREQMIREAYDKEMSAVGNSKKARILKSGTFQGAAGGAGIGAATGVGLGTVVGTIVGTAATIPTTAVGALVGGGVGVFHGPWFKLNGGKGKGEEENKVPTEAIESGAVSVNGDTGEVKVQDKEALKQATEKAKQKEQETAKAGAPTSKEGKERKKPKKIEVRSNKNAAATAGSPTSKDGKEKKKPRKLEVRSNKNAPAKAGPGASSNGNGKKVP